MPPGAVARPGRSMWRTGLEDGHAVGGDHLAGAASPYPQLMNKNGRGIGKSQPKRGPVFCTHAVRCAENGCCVHDGNAPLTCAKRVGRGATGDPSSSTEEMPAERQADSM
jgi:hypothetical protein